MLKSHKSPDDVIVFFSFEYSADCLLQGEKTPESVKEFMQKKLR